MRPSELLGMRWDDFDPDARTVLLRYTKNGPSAHGAFVNTSPQCDKGNSTLQPMHSGLHGSD